jgi:hypothetical protein
LRRVGVAFNCRQFLRSFLQWDNRQICRIGIFLHLGNKCDCLRLKADLGAYHTNCQLLLQVEVTSYLFGCALLKFRVPKQQLVVLSISNMMSFEFFILGGRHGKQPKRIH